MPPEAWDCPTVPSANSDGVPKDVLDAMHPKRQSLFRGVWTGAGEGKSGNKYIDESNRAM